MKKIFTLCMLLAALVIHAAEPIQWFPEPEKKATPIEHPVLTISSMDFKMQFYPHRDFGIGGSTIIFKNNKGNCLKFEITFDSGRKITLPMKISTTNKDRDLLYESFVLITESDYIDAFGSDNIKEIHFSIANFGNGQTATIPLPQKVRDEFAAMVQNLREHKTYQRPQVKELEFLGIPIDGSVASFVEKLKAKGYQVVKQTETTAELKGNFWLFENCTIILCCNTYINKSVAAVWVKVGSMSLSKANKEDLIRHLNNLYNRNEKIRWQLPNGTIWVEGFLPDQFTIKFNTKRFI